MTHIPSMAIRSVYFRPRGVTSIMDRPGAVTRSALKQTSDFFFSFDEGTAKVRLL